MMRSDVDDGHEERDDEKDDKQQAIDDLRELYPLVEHQLLVAAGTTARRRLSCTDPQVLADVFERRLDGAILRRVRCRRGRIGVGRRERHVALGVVVEVPRDAHVRLGGHAQHATETAQKDLSTAKSATWGLCKVKKIKRIKKPG